MTHLTGKQEGVANVKFGTNIRLLTGNSKKLIDNEIFISEIFLLFIHWIGYGHFQSFNFTSYKLLQQNLLYFFIYSSARSAILQIYFF
jgi:hypothetical protein